ncbi:MAG: type II toxin-antitoxin system VapB family antitoxin [Deltaproteobacteria bacterium]|nr:type II toxin-antitoxin system VapB family antitoxin [Deltaproteobacteria bacterium]
METAKVFQNGNSQAIRLPKAFRFTCHEVKIYKKGNQVVLEPLETTWDAMFEALSEFPDDVFEDGRRQPLMQERESL